MGAPSGFLVMKPLRQCSYPWMKYSFSKFSTQHLYFLVNWERIIGNELGKKTKLIKVNFPFGKRYKGRLFIEVNSASVGVLTHCIGKILERANAFYGYPAFSYVSFLHNSFSTQKREQTMPSIDAFTTSASLNLALSHLSQTLSQQQ